MATWKPAPGSGLAIVAVVAVVAIVAVVGTTVWYQRLAREPAGGEQPADTQSEAWQRAPDGEATTTPQERSPRPVVQRDIPPLEPGTMIRARDGLAFEPARIGSRFIGYRVLANTSDPRFEIGDIIVSVAGSPVEDSPAGGELFLATLSNPEAAVQLYESGTAP